MVFSSSVPVYLDPPNWHQHPNQQQVVPSDESSQQLPPLPPPHLVGGATASSIRPGSMADRARLAKIPQPEAALKCPRCESTNTKFCYFNNYSLTQPRHFCKTCRRYWTRGGALRSVPVGGGCRRNKKSKSQTGSKSSSGSSEKQMSSTSNSSSTSAAIPQLPFMGSLNNFTQFGVGNLGLNFGGINQGPVGSITSGANGQTDMGIFHMGINSGMQQFPFFEASQNNGLYPNFQSAETPSTIVGDGQLGSMASSSSRVSQLGTVKTEENNGLNLSRSFLGISESNHQFWAGGNSWTDLSGLNSSSTSHHLL